MRRLLGGGGGGSGGSGCTTLGCESSAPVERSQYMLITSGLEKKTYMKVLEKKEMPIIKAQLGMTEKP